MLAIITVGANADAQTVEDYDRGLPLWGTSWSPSARSLKGYHPSFYTGFAPRVETPDRIHIHMARGNQTRVTLILDEETIENYLYDLAKRAEFYRFAIDSQWINVTPVDAQFTAHAQAFDSIIKSDVYRIKEFTSAPRSKEDTYRHSIAMMRRLNRSRIFSINIDLRKEFLKWRTEILNTYSTRELETPETAAFAINTLLLGRINFVETPTREMSAKLVTLRQMQNSNGFILGALDLFRTATQGKFNFNVLDERGQWASAIQCESERSCYLRYTEFTAIYPTGSTKNQVADSFGNSIPDLALPGLWNFESNPGADVDNVNPEPYYGFIPKLDYEDIGLNFGFHNPAVRFYQVDPSIKNLLSIPAPHSTYWSVKRGGVSHGCSRLAAGHIWELRHILPVEDSKMKQVKLFANLAQEFDVYDVDGNGIPEVMGVEYLLSYDLSDASNGLSREGQTFEIGLTRKTPFYQNLYGARNVFDVDLASGRAQFLFRRPVIAVHTFTDDRQRMVHRRYQSNQDLYLYEQPYEKDKVQFYDPISIALLDGYSQTPLSKRLVRLFGRVRGCQPTANKTQCGELSFESEKNQIAAEINALKGNP